MTIVELLVALVIVMIVFAGLASTVIASFSSIRNTEARVRGIALANELVEEMATIPWDRLGHDRDAEDEDDSIPPKEFEGEQLVVIGAVANPILRNPSDPDFEQTMTRDGHDYTVERWVTWAEEDGQPELKRMVAEVTWTVGGTEASIRSDGLRAPDAQDVFDLEVRVDAVANYADGGNEAMWLHHISHTDFPHRNRRSFTVTANLGVVDSSVQLRFRDRSGGLVTRTGADTGEGTSTRTWSISSNEYSLRHGRTSFTVFATGPDDQIASDTATLRFYQPLEIQSPIMLQDGVVVWENGSSVTPIEVDQDGDLCGQLTVEADVWGMTPGEATPTAAGDGGLTLEWQGATVVMALLQNERFGGRYIGEVGTVLIPDPLPDPFVPVDFQETFEVVADRLDEAHNHFQEFDDFAMLADVRVVASC